MTTTTVLDPARSDAAAHRERTRTGIRSDPA